MSVLGVCRVFGYFTGVPFAFGCVYDLVLRDWVVTIVIFKSELFWGLEVYQGCYG